MAPELVTHQDTIVTTNSYSSTAIMMYMKIDVIQGSRPDKYVLGSQIKTKEKIRASSRLSTVLEQLPLSAIERQLRSRRSAAKTVVVGQKPSDWKLTCPMGTLRRDQHTALAMIHWMGPTVTCLEPAGNTVEVESVLRRDERWPTTIEPVGHTLQTPQATVQPASVSKSYRTGEQVLL